MRRVGDRFVLEHIIGSGGMSAVYLGSDEVLDRRVAVKILKSGFEAARFRREGRVAAGLSHPNIVQVYDAGEDVLDGREVSYIVMEYVPGGDLKELLKREGPLPERRLAKIGADIASGLAHAHERGIVHRDVKPQNVLLDEYGNPRLTDFGIARALDAAQATQATQTGAYLGTASYSSPEQLKGERATPKSDVYSLGVTLYEAATGEPPFSGTPIEVAQLHFSEEPVPPTGRGARLSAGVEALILACLAKDPESRPGAEEVRSRLAAVEPAGTSRAYAAPPAAELRPAPAAVASSPPGDAAGGAARRERGGRARPALATLALVAVLAAAGAFAVPALLGTGEEESAPGQAARQEQPPVKEGGSGGQQQEPAPRDRQERAAAPAAGVAEGALTATGAERTVRDIYERAARNDYRTSYAMLSQGLRQSTFTSIQVWEQTFSTLEDISFEEGPTARVSGGTATVTGTTIARHTDRTERNSGTWTLIREGGEWKLDSISVRTRRI